MAPENVRLSIQPSYVIMDNGILKLTISKPSGLLAAIQYGGMDNLLDNKLKETQRGYWDLNWNLPGGQDRYQLLRGLEFSVINSSNNCVEVSFWAEYHSAANGVILPLSVDIRYIVRSGISGFYCYSIYERVAGLPGFDLVQTRMVFKLRRDKFHYMAISDEKQRIMPSLEDIFPPRGKVLALPESVLLVNPINPALRGQVDDKYQFSMDNKDGGVHGWISSGSSPIGFWLIFPSHEFRSGGPTKQNLTAHTGPSCLAMFHGTHYIGGDIVSTFATGEAWRKVFGPVFIYLNSTLSISYAHNLWIDAKKQRFLEETTWPYGFVSSPYFFTSRERGSASGNLFVQDSFVSGVPIPARFAYVGLSIARHGGSWQLESKGYQFWVVTDSDGAFTIKNIIPGAYYVHGFMPGFIGDYLHDKLVKISSGSESELGNLTYIPPRDGPTIWEIGYPDRTAMGFYVPDPNPMYINKLFINSPEKFRQYGLWDRYTDLHPQFDQVFMVGVNDAKKDWFFAHVNRLDFLLKHVACKRHTGFGIYQIWILDEEHKERTRYILVSPRKVVENRYSPSTWQIKFNLDTITNGTYKLRLSIAASNHSDLQVRVNNPNSSQPLFEAYDLGADSTIARHGIHGLYQLLNIDISSSLLIKGGNIIYLKQMMSGNEFLGLLYDYLRFESPTAYQQPEQS